MVIFHKTWRCCFYQKYRCWSPKNALPVCPHRICLWFKYRYEKSWKMCYRHTVNEYVCSLSTVLNTGTLSSKNELPVYCHLIQFAIFKLLNNCFEKTIGFDVKASFESRPLSRLIRWYNKSGDITKEFW